ncbi:MAG TPA: DUF4244 domain-containing protein [Jiangellaceae bacterium]|jgi:hypothetical protein
MSKIAAWLRRTSERGMATAEYAVGTVAACGIAGVLYKLVENDSILGFLTDLARKAFGILG